MQRDSEATNRKSVASVAQSVERLASKLFVESSTPGGSIVFAFILRETFLTKLIIYDDFVQGQQKRHDIRLKSYGITLSK